MTQALSRSLQQALGLWGHGRVPGRLRMRAYISTAAADPAPAPEPAAAAKPTSIFSSRAKIAPACPAWLKSSRSR